MQGDDGVLQLRQRLGLVGADPRPDQLGGSAGQGLVRLVGNDGPVRVAVPGPSVPLRVYLGEPASGGLQPLDRGRPGRGHVDVESPRESGFLGQEAQERAAADAERLLVGSVVRDRSHGLDDVTEQELPAPAGRREEAVFPAAEVKVEGCAGHSRPAHDVGHCDRWVPLVRDRGYCGAQQPLALRRLYGWCGKTAAAPRQPRLSRVCPGKGPLLLGVEHEPTVTGKFLKYRIVL